MRQVLMWTYVVLQGLSVLLYINNVGKQRKPLTVRDVQLLTFMSFVWSLAVLYIGGVL